jgi:indolepyruvate ferredoxin oxidoreductase beta subunit
MDEFNILIGGVRGQVFLFTSEVLGEAAIKSGLNVRVAEIHGMAQRGGSVVCNVRLGKDVYSPTIDEGRAHLILSLEPIEALRRLKFANPETVFALNLNKIEPPGIYVSNKKYPEMNLIFDRLKAVSKNILAINALKLANEAGNPATQNTVMLGLISASNKLPINTQLLKKTVVTMINKKFQESNKIAFDLGFKSYEKSKKYT